MIGKHT